MALEITGRLLQKLPVFNGVSARGNWSKQEFVIETQETYPRKVCLSVFGDDKVKELTAFSEGDILKISINIESREYNGRWYTEIRAWRISKDAPEGVPTPPPPTVPPIQSATPLQLDGDDGTDDLPF